MNINLSDMPTMDGSTSSSPPRACKGSNKQKNLPMTSFPQAYMNMGTTNGPQLLVYGTTNGNQ